MVGQLDESIKNLSRLIKKASCVYSLPYEGISNFTQN